MKPEENVGHLLSMLKMTLSTAESCTGGGVAAAVTSVPGSSEYFKGGVVAYSNEVKMSLLHVSPATLEKHGAVSCETVIEMAQGIRQLLHTDCAIATSGIAGPGGGTPVKPVGTIWIAIICKNEISTCMLTGDYGRSENVRRTIENALSMLYSQLKQGKNTIIQ